MEGISQLSQAREIVAACPEYWETGKPHYEVEVAAACEGLLAGGATEVIVLDNHASGNPANISPQRSLPARGSSRGMSGTFPSTVSTRCSRWAITLVAAWTGFTRTPTGSTFASATATSSSPRVTVAPEPRGHA